MPPQQTNQISETGRDATALGLDRAIASVQDAIDDAPAPAHPRAITAALDDVLSEKQAVGPPDASTRGVLSLLERYWRAYQEWRRLRGLRVTLQDLSERELMDIGVTRAEIDYIIAHRDLDRLRDGTAYLWIMSRVM